jgi:hypothetical protein
VFGKIFNNSEPVSVLGTSAIPASLLAAYVSRIQQFCPNYSGLGGSDHPALSGLDADQRSDRKVPRHRTLRALSLQPQLLYRLHIRRPIGGPHGRPDSILMHNQTLVPGAQVLGIPLHKASVGLDVVNNSGFEARLDTYYVGANNGFNRPEYFYSNATVSQRFGKSTTLNLGVFNAFNSATDTYGRIGLGVFAGQNKFGTSKNAFDQGSERFALPPTQIQLTVSTKLF